MTSMSNDPMLTPELMTDLELFLEDDFMNSFLEEPLPAERKAKLSPSSDCVSELGSVGDVPDDSKSEQPSSSDADSTAPAPKKTNKRPASGPSRRTSHKRPKGIPKRPLSAYNLFFKSQRSKIFEEAREKIGFEQMGRTIGARWRSLPPGERKIYEEKAQKDIFRYRKEMDTFEDVKRKSMNMTTFPPEGRSETTKPTSSASPTASSPSTQRTAGSPVHVTPPVTPQVTRQTASTPLPIAGGFEPSSPVRARLPDGHPYGQCGSHRVCAGPPAISSPPPTAVARRVSEAGHARGCLSYRGPQPPPPPPPPPPRTTSAGWDTRGEHRSLSPSSAFGGHGGENPASRQVSWSGPPPLQCQVRPPVQACSTIRTNTTVFLPDGPRRLRMYALHYECYRMSRSEADSYLERLSRESGNSPPSSADNNHQSP